MSESDEIAGLASDLEARLARKLGLRRGPLAARVKKAGRQLPRRVRRDARVIGEAMTLAAHPRLRRRIDRATVHAAHDRIARHLDGIDPAARRAHFRLGVLAGLAVNMLLASALLLVLLRWRGLI